MGPLRTSATARRYVLEKQIEEKEKTGRAGDVCVSALSIAFVRGRFKRVVRSTDFRWHRATASDSPCAPPPPLPVLKTRVSRRSDSDRRHAGTRRFGHKPRNPSGQRRPFWPCTAACCCCTSAVGPRRRRFPLASTGLERRAAAAPARSDGRSGPAKNRRLKHRKRAPFHDRFRDHRRGSPRGGFFSEFSPRKRFFTTGAVRNA